MWNRRQCTFFNGTPYVIQRAAEAYYSPEGQKQCLADVNYYMENAHIIRDGLVAAGFTVYGATNSPYAWVQTPNGMKSWDFFDLLLEKAHVVTTPLRLRTSRRRLPAPDGLRHEGKHHRSGQTYC